MMSLSIILGWVFLFSRIVLLFTVYPVVLMSCNDVFNMQGLGIWCTTQREMYKFEKDDMPKERIEALDALGFSWSRWGRQRSKARKDAWDKMFQELVEYKNVSLLSDSDLCNWVNFVRLALKILCCRSMEIATYPNMMNRTSNLGNGQR